MNLVQGKIIEKNKSIRKLTFPFPLRKGQTEIIKYSEECILEKKVRFLEASTGLGKTISIVFGALKGSIKSKTDKIFFLAAKNSGFKSASDCLQILRESGLKITSIEILAKEKMCLNKNHNCNPDDCPFAREYYDKINKILIESLVNENELSSEKIIEIGERNLICPFELSLDLSLNADFIIMDYNYLYNPISYLRRFFDVPENTYNNFLIVDEAHNLVDRSRDMYSASINNAEFEIAKKSYKSIKSNKFKEIMDKLTEDFDLFSKFESDDENILLEKLDDDFVNHLNTYQDAIRKYRKNHPKYKNIEDKGFGLDVFKFLTIYELISECYKIYVKKDDSNYSINLFCVDASRFILGLTPKINGTIFFSGTLTPIDYYQKAILGSSNYDKLIVSSPFDKENLLVLYDKSISIRYKDRENSLKDVMNTITAFVSNKVGNYITFVPSFAYLKMLKDTFSNEKVNVYFQSDEMTNKDKTLFLSKFKNNPSKTTIGICVLGGSFSEGIDLVDDRLIGIIVIGVGLPSISFENNLILDYYNKNKMPGFSYAYTNPGINKVMQAVGRLIRSEKDRGIALLIDDRYGYKEYAELFKNVWLNNKKVNSINTIKSEINSFYKPTDKV